MLLTWEPSSVILIRMKSSACRRYIPAALVAILVAFPLPADPLAWTGVATHDGLYAAVVNPAALAVGNAAGFGVDAPVTEPLQRLALYLNAPGAAYVFDAASETSRHRISSSARWDRAFSLGTTWRWGEDGFRAGALDLGLLSRPMRALSVGAVGYDLLDDGRSLTTGVGIRPLVSLPGLGSRLTIGADAEWDFSDSFAVSHIYAEVEPFDGIRIAAGYHSREGSFAIRGAVNTRHFETGVSYDGGVRASGFLSVRPRRSLFSAVTPTAVDYDRLERLAATPGVVAFAPGVPLAHLLEDLARYRADPAVQAIVLENVNVPGSFADIVELSEALTAFREAGKSVYFFYDSISQVDYLLAASTADSIVLHPLGSVDARGLSYTGFYLADLLERYGVRLNSYPSHEFKTANAPLSESEMSDAERLMMEALVEDLYGTYVDLVAGGRTGRLARDAEAAIAYGPYLRAEEALEAGLVDALGYPDEIWELVEERHPWARRVGPARIEETVYEWAPPPRSRVAMIYAAGLIVTGEGVRGRMIGAATMSAAIRDARENPLVRGIIIRVDSGGGSAIASDTIAREIAKTVEAGKPVVVSMAGTAASGGYYISAPASHIVAGATTITGSIGVVAGVLTVDGLLDQLAVTTETIRTTPGADFGSPLRPPSPDEEEEFAEYIEWTYDRFVEVVADSRGMSRDQVHAVAQGRVWTGAQAFEHGLVDSVGGIAHSVRVMRDLLGTRALEIVEVVPGPTAQSLVSELASLLAPRRFPGHEAELRELIDYATLFSRHSGEALYLMPYRVK